MSESKDLKDRILQMRQDNNIDTSHIGTTVLCLYPTPKSLNAPSSSYTIDGLI